MGGRIAQCPPGPATEGINTLLCWKKHSIHKAFPTFSIHISSATHIFEGFNLVINILKTDTNTHHLTVPKEYMKGNVKYSKLVGIYIYMYQQIKTVSKVQSFITIE